MKYVLNGSQMKACDSTVINHDLQKSLELIERASDSCIWHLQDLDFDRKKCLIVCGKGNNGADGFAIAAKLYKLKIDVEVLVADKNSSFSAEADFYFKQLKMPVFDYNEFSEHIDVNSYTLIVDAIFGIGLSRGVEGVYADMIHLINNSDAKVLSVDIPSGISSDNGAIMKAAVNADVTVTFACYKTGQLLYPGKAACGKLYLEDIGIPVIEDEKPSYLVTDLFDDNNLLPYRKPDGHKGTFGKVLVIAGSKDIFGAAYLCAMSAYKAGCGMVHILTERHNAEGLKVLIPEALLHFYDEDNPDDAINQAKELSGICDVICAGPGLSVNACACAMIKYLVSIDKPLVLDADALNIISKEKLIGRINKGNCILTPHIMEMSRLSDISCNDIKKDCVGVALNFAREYNLVLVLKDAVTLVSAPEYNTYINQSGNAAMAKAGSGDVLSGIISGLLAQKCSLYDAACLGVYIHGLIGDKKLYETGAYSLMARNLIDGIEELFNEQ